MNISRITHTRYCRESRATRFFGAGSYACTSSYARIDRTRVRSA